MSLELYEFSLESKKIYKNFGNYVLFSADISQNWRNIDNKEGSMTVF